jgi:hypothetical protein
MGSDERRFGYADYTLSIAQIALAFAKPTAPTGFIGLMRRMRQVP